jgi:hypothetical protein
MIIFSAFNSSLQAYRKYRPPVLLRKHIVRYFALQKTDQAISSVILINRRWIVELFNCYFCEATDHKMTCKIVLFFRKES